MQAALWPRILMGMSLAAVLAVADGSRPISAQDDSRSLVIRGPITALHADTDRLLIGQGSLLIMARVTDNDLIVTASIDLRRHDLRAFAVNHGVILALSEDGLTSLDNKGNVLDFAPGGGQTLAVNQDRVYVAALKAGVRMLKLDAAGKLSPLGTIRTRGTARDAAAEGTSLVWVAEDDQGVRLYDVHDPKMTSVITWLGGVIPAAIVRTGPARLYITYSGKLAILDTVDLKVPRLLGIFARKDDSAYFDDLLLIGSRAFIGRVEAGGPDLLSLDISNPRAVNVIGQFGEAGTGERLALWAADVFIGSGQQGLRRIRFDTGGAVLLKTWQPSGEVQACKLTSPTQPQPPDSAEVPNGMVTLTWATACGASLYEVRIDGKLVTTQNSATYTLTPDGHHVTWQVTAVDAAGNRAEGPTWTFETSVEGWLATPATVTGTKLLYAPSPLTLPQLDLRSPGAVIAATCIALAIGLILVVAIAWLVGSRAERSSRKL